MLEKIGKKKVFERRCCVKIVLVVSKRLRIFIKFYYEGIFVILLRFINVEIISFIS